MLQEPGAGFCDFAALVFVGCPLVAGLIAVAQAPRSWPQRFMTSSGRVFGLTLLLFLGTYAVLPQFERANVSLPAACAGCAGGSPRRPA